MKLNVHCTLSIDWEGHSLAPQNLRAMTHFNELYPNIPKLHFLNAAYYDNLSSSKKRSEISNAIKSTFGPNDEFGLHIHPWRDFVESAGVTYRNGPSYLKEDSESQPLAGLSGGDVPLTAYTESEIHTLIEYSLTQLKTEGFKDIHFFRGGGWVSGPSVYRVLQGFQIARECSPVPSSFLDPLYAGTPLQNMAQVNWAKISHLSEPQDLPEYNLRQYPNNLCLADYLTAKEALDLAKKVIDHAIAQRKDSAYLHFGWHQESAAVSLKTKPPKETGYLNRVLVFLEQLQIFCKQEGHHLSFPRLSHI